MIKGTGHGIWRSLAVMLVVFALLLTGAMMLIDYMNDASEDAQLEMVENAVRDAVITCYAVEGAYPSDLQYLVDNYGLYYDKDTYIVFYDAFASNVMPEIRVRLRGGQAHE